MRVLYRKTREREGLPVYKYKGTRKIKTLKHTLYNNSKNNHHHHNNLWLGLSFCFYTLWAERSLARARIINIYFEKKKRARENIQTEKIFLSFFLG